MCLHEAVNGLALKENGIYIDGTFGRGGHSRLILSQLSENGRLIAIDRDPRAIAEAEKIQDPRFHIEHNSFSHIPDICQKLDLVGKIDGILLDLGVSSPQLDEAERGFSFMKDGPLDMRMDTTQGLSAAEWLKQVSVDDLTWVLKTFGEERFAKRIATAIVEFNKSAVKNAWGLREKDSVIILLDKTGKVQFVKEGKLTDDEVKEVISRATALMAK